MSESEAIFMPRKKKIALTGFRYTGKSTIAKNLSRRWHIPHVSMDDEIEKEYGESIVQMVSEHGWNFFRSKEMNILKLITSEQKSSIILDTGGGVVEGYNEEKGQEKIDILRNNFLTIFISITEETLMERIEQLNKKNINPKKNMQRPGLGGANNTEELIKIYRRRKEWYKEAAHVVVDISDAGVNDSVKRIELLLNKEKYKRKKKEKI